MTVQDAKKIIREDPRGDILQRLETLEVAKPFLPENYTAGDLYKWAEDENVESEKEIALDVGCSEQTVRQVLKEAAVQK